MLRNGKNIALSCVAINQNKHTFTVCVPVFFLKCFGLVLLFCLDLHIYFNCLQLIFFIATRLTKIRVFFSLFFIFPI